MNRSRLKQAVVGWLLASAFAVFPAQPASDAHWVVTWSAPPDSTGPIIAGQTVRQIIRTSIGGSSVRIRVSNLFGTGPIAIHAARLARHASGSAIQPGTDHAITFGGKPVVTLARGTAALSDPVMLPVMALEALAVSLYLPVGNGPSTVHDNALQTAFITSGNTTAETTLATAKTDSRRYFLTDLEVAASAAARAIVIVGDSITDGVGSTEDHNARWPDVLAERLQADPALASIAVLNSGIAGNRILNDGVDPFVGPSMLRRFDRDALSKPGVRWVLLFAGINDISASGVLTAPRDKVTAQQIIRGMQWLIARARAKNMKIWGATLMPLEGVEPPFHSAAGEEMRQDVNAWIRTSGAFDAVIDFDQVTRDPSRPERLRPELDSGDHLHPNDAGHQAMAAAIDLRLLWSRK